MLTVIIYKCLKSGEKTQKNGIIEMRISKKTNNLNFTCDKIYNYISDINNYELILGDEIKDFNIIDKEIFCIKIGGLPSIELKLETNDNEKSIKLLSSNPKMIFHFSFLVKKIDETNSEIEIEFNGEFSSMMEMMIKNPITKFTDEIATKISQVNFNI